MLRFGILIAVVPLVLAGGVAYDWTQASARQCSAAALTTARTAPAIAFTDDPSLATVKVQIVDGAELADLAIADDGDQADAPGCGVHQIARLFRISAGPIPGAPVVHLSREADADYRIYVDSTRISAEEAAALIVAARGGHRRLAASGDTLHTGSIR